MPCKYVEVIRPTEMGELGSSKASKKRREAWALMLLREKEMKAAKVLYDKEVAETTRLVQEEKAVAQQLQSKGVTLEQMKRIVKGKLKLSAMKWGK